MPQLSVIISDHLNQKIIEKARQIGVENISEAVRVLLMSAIENDDLSSNGSRERALCNHAINYSITDHYLLEECLLAFAEGSAGIKEKAYAKAEKFVTAILQETS